VEFELAALQTLVSRGRAACGRLGRLVADVGHTAGIRAGRVAAIGRLEAAPAKRRIDAAGRVVAPGFIDMLGQSELSFGSQRV
jgi:N-acyl-D-aspartate/D-glutamate deacylase